MAGITLHGLAADLHHKDDILAADGCKPEKLQRGSRSADDE
jgi:hypothetical protein